MASTACVNPSMTFMALTARAADHAVKLVKAGTIYVYMNEDVED